MHEGLVEAATKAPIGLMAQPESAVHWYVHQFKWWAADNGCFAKGDEFDLDKFYTWLGNRYCDRATCLFAVAPDVLCDARATVVRSLPVMPVIRDMGFNAAFVAQDGLTLGQTPWDAFDCLFIGGSTAWKFSEVVVGLVAYARQLGKWTHMGRVNSKQRMRYAASIGIDSVDGTYIKFGPTTNIPRLVSWFTEGVCV